MLASFNLLSSISTSMGPDIMYNVKSNDSTVSVLYTVQVHWYITGVTVHFDFLITSMNTFFSESL